MQGDMSTLLSLMELFYGGEKGVGMMGQLMHSLMTVGVDGKPKKEEQAAKKAVGGVAAGATTQQLFVGSVKEAMADARRMSEQQVQPDLFEQAILDQVEQLGFKGEEAEYFARVSAIMAEDVRAAVEHEPDLTKRADLAKQAAAELIPKRRVIYNACLEIIQGGTQALDAMFQANPSGLSTFLQQTELTTIYYQIKQAEHAQDQSRLAKLNEELKKRCEAIKAGRSFSQEDQLKHERHQVRRGR